MISFYLTATHFTAVFSWVVTRLLSIAFTQVDKKNINKYKLFLKVHFRDDLPPLVNGDFVNN